MSRHGLNARRRSVGCARTLAMAATFALGCLVSTAARADALPDPHAAPHASASTAAGHAAAHGGVPAAHGSVATHAAAEHALGEHAAAEHVKDEHSAGEHDGAPEPMNWADFGNSKQPPYLALLLNFAVLLGLFYYFGKDKIAAGLQERKATITNNIEEAARMKAAATERAEKYQKNLKNLDKDRATTKAALEAAGQKERDALVASAKEKAERMARDADFILAQERKQTRLDILRATVDGAANSAESLLNSHANADDHERLVKLFLEELAGRTPNAAAGTARQTAGESA